MAFMVIKTERIESPLDAMRVAICLYILIYDLLLSTSTVCLFPVDDTLCSV